MARIEGVEPKDAGFFTKLIYRMARGKVGQLTGRKELIEPVKILAHHPRVLLSMGMMDGGLEKANSVKSRYKNLAMTQVARMVGCPF